MKTLTLKHPRLPRLASGMLGTIFSTPALCAIPTRVGNLSIESDDIVSTVFSVVQLFLYYGAWIAIGVALLVGVYSIIGALSESRKKGDNSILWSSILNTLVVTIIVVVVAILIISFMDI